jgi:hypothetical protein
MESAEPNTPVVKLTACGKCGEPRETYQHCRTCKAEYDRIYKAANRKHITERQRGYRARPSVRARAAAVASSSPLRKCKACGEEKPLESDFELDAGYYRHACKKCRNEQQNARRERNHDRVRARERNYEARNRERKNKVSRVWRASNPEKIKGYKRREYEAHGDEIRARTWKRKQHSRALSFGVEVEMVDKPAIIARDNATCYLCGAQHEANSPGLSLDHVIPVTRGGSHTSGNLKVACCRCNSRKKEKIPHELKWFEGPCPCAECVVKSEHPTARRPHNENACIAT